MGLVVKSFTLEPEVIDYVSKTKGNRSASDRANELLRIGMAEEQARQLAAEAATFYGAPKKSVRRGAKAFQKASLRTWDRD
jgi:hypothetical protein